jgi:hypothetical protein
MKPRHAAAWGALIGFLMPIGIYVAMFISPSVIAFDSWLFWLWPGAILLETIGVSGPAATSLAVQVLVLIIALGTNAVLYSMLGWLVARVFGRPVRPHPA